MASAPLPGLAGLIVFTSSRAAQAGSFTLGNVQHMGGPDPYGSSKRAVDLLCVALSRASPLRVYSVCPGLVVSQLTAALLPPWMWAALTPLFWMVRLRCPSVNSHVHFSLPYSLLPVPRPPSPGAPA